MADLRSPALVVRQAAVVACAGMIVATVATLATNHPGRASAGSLRMPSDLASGAPTSSGVGGAGGAAVQSPTVAVPATQALGAASGSSVSTSPVSTSVSPLPASPVPADTGGGGSAAAPPGSSGPPPPPAAGSTSVAVVSPVFQLMALGGQVAVPLVCNVAAGAAGSNITDPTISAVVANVAASCASMANKGADSLRTLDTNLGQLAVINPAVRPLLSQLAAAFKQAAGSGVPFVQSVEDLAALLQFLNG